MRLTHKLYQGDCLKVLADLDPVDCIFADPPDNIGLGYDSYDDRKSEDEYRGLLEDWVTAFMEKAPIIWISFNARWTFALGTMFDSIVRSGQYKDWEAKPCVQVFTFGQHNKNDLGNNHRPLWRLKRKDIPLYPEAIKVPSWRQRNGDKRAAAGGRVPGDVFDMQYPSPQTNRIGSWLAAAENDPTACAEFKADINEWFDTHNGDVFDFPRVTGNSKQRRDFHPTQLHEDLVERCIRLSTKEGDRVSDPFGGTGTTLRVCKKINRSCTLIELDPLYCQKISEEHGIKVTRHPSANAEAA